MTNQNDTSQAKLTDDQIEVLAKKHIAPHADRLDKLLPHRVPYRQTEQFRRVKALIGDVLSRLRAPVADEWVLPPLPAAWGSAINDAGDGHVDLYSAEQMQEYTRAALASAPVADDWTPTPVNINALPERVRAYIHDLVANADPSGMVAENTLLRDQTKQLDAMIGRLKRELASAPVAGEAQPEIEQMAVNRYRPVPDGKFSYKVVAGDGSRSLYTGTKDSCLRVAAKLTEAFLDGAFVASDAAPQASAVAGEAPTWEQVRDELAILLSGATGKRSAFWERPLDDAATGRGALAKMRALLAAPQASAMPPLTDAMRAVISNERDVYQTPDALYGALCDAARDADKEQGNG